MTKDLARARLPPRSPLSLDPSHMSSYRDVVRNFGSFPSALAITQDGAELRSVIRLRLNDHFGQTRPRTLGLDSGRFIRSSPFVAPSVVARADR
jgi:hypothetical protein